MGCYTRWADYEVMLTQVKHRKRDHQCSSAQVQSPTRTSEQRTSPSIWTTAHLTD
jgi:hypothetical protein